MVSCKGLKVCPLLCSCNQLPSCHSRATLRGVGGWQLTGTLSVVCRGRAHKKALWNPLEGFPFVQLARLLHPEAAWHSRTCIITFAVGPVYSPCWDGFVLVVNESMTGM